ncbi:MAG TPA: ATP-binding cassette domain-containing protein [Gammaproteobacteria bacterium]|jgi:molybdate transport system ATP-binding protein|nr:ATP-binding cassette domain-containing protein [Gammaproteobacteria bacterium]
MTSAPLVRLEHVDVALDGTKILHDVTWQLPRGEHWGIVGANGSGKSTLLGLIGGTLWPAPESGERRYDFGAGPETDAVRARSEIALVSHELQDRYARLDWNFTALDVVLSGVYRTDVPRRRPATEQRSRALAVMRRLGVAKLAERRFLELSRGEQRRVLIARGVAFGPTVLLLDEPASGLDPPARAELAAMLDVVARECTLVCTAHVPGDLPPMIRHYLRVEHGRIVARETRIANAAPRDPSNAASRPAPSRTRPAPAVAQGVGEPLIELEHADVWLGSRHVLHDVSWCLAPGQQWLVTGANGSGKSTFLRLLHGQLRPALGSEIRWPALGNPRNVWELRKRVAWLSPELQAAYRYPSTVRACVASGFESSIGQTRTLSAEESARVDELLAEFELTYLAERPLRMLSYGQARRTLIARALANRPRVLLLDEPWEGLDASMAGLLNRALGAVIAEGTQIVCTSHLTAHREHFTHHLLLEAGHVALATALPGA